MEKLKKNKDRLLFIIITSLGIATSFGIVANYFFNDAVISIFSIILGFAVGLRWAYSINVSDEKGNKEENKKVEIFQNTEGKIIKDKFREYYIVKKNEFFVSADPCMNEHGILDISFSSFRNNAVHFQTKDLALECAKRINGEIIYVVERETTTRYETILNE